MCHDDVLWINSKTGQVDEWVMRDGNWSASVDLGATHGSTDWQVAGIGDFNGDGTADILWRNPTTGQVDAWQMQGGQWAASVDLGANKGSGWSVAGIGDFEHTGTAQVLWYNASTGSLDEWRMADGTWSASVDRGTESGATYVASGDVNHDGAADSLWVDSSGHVHTQLLFV